MGRRKPCLEQASRKVVGGSQPTSLTADIFITGIHDRHGARVACGTIVSQIRRSIWSQLVSVHPSTKELPHVNRISSDGNISVVTKRWLNGFNIPANGRPVSIIIAGLCKDMQVCGNLDALAAGILLNISPIINPSLANEEGDPSHGE